MPSCNVSMCVISFYRLQGLNKASFKKKDDIKKKDY